MPNVRSQRIYDAGDSLALEIVGTSTLTLSKAAIQAFYQSTSGSAASRRAQVIAWIEGQVQTALGGPTMCSLTSLNYDFSLDGGITLAEIGA